MAGGSRHNTAVLDRIIHLAEVIHLRGPSYRMRHRTTIFRDDSVQFYLPFS
ncbi:ATP-binding protein [Paenibacillus abyssi]|uniref:ATP-binding protein n=1 Tax=Paenibacillus abyssi TaxID=1340531 RepID=UPI00360C1122